jgi:hypothetical protein
MSGVVVRRVSEHASWFVVLGLDRVQQVGLNVGPGVVVVQGGASQGQAEVLLSAYRGHAPGLRQRACLSMVFGGWWSARCGGWALGGVVSRGEDGGWCSRLSGKEAVR